MRLPGSLKALSEQLRAAGLGEPSGLQFDPDGNLLRVDLSPVRRPEAVPTAAKAQNMEAQAKAAQAKTQTAIASLRAVPPASIFEDDNAMGRRG